MKIKGRCTKIAAIPIELRPVLCRLLSRTEVEHEVCPSQGEIL
ncbi:MULTISPECIES: hypothetical protein [Pelotomaculum]|nr:MULTISPECIES: hypothetical protein [Pelotomaculum]